MLPHSCFFCMMVAYIEQHAFGEQIAAAIYHRFFFKFVQAIGRTGAFHRDFSFMRA